VPLLLAALLLVVGAACGGKPGGDADGGKGRSGGDGPRAQRTSGEKGSKPEQPAVPVIVQRVARADMNSFLDASATLEAEERVEVVSEATGVVAEILVEEGENVEKGQLLARLAYEELELAEQRARSELERLEADFARSQELSEEDLISEDEFQQIRFDLERARIDWKQAKLELDRTRITAPIRGTVSERYIRLGALVSRNEVAYDIVDFQSIVAPVFVSEQYLRELHVGQRVLLRAPALGQQRVEGTIERVSPVVDAESGTVEVTVNVGDIGRLRPGMFVSAQIVLDTHEDAMAVPKNALVYEDESPHLFVVEAGRAQRKEVQLGYEGAELVEVVSGLQGDEWIVLVGQSGLKSDSLVAAETREGETITFPDQDSGAATTDEERAQQGAGEEALS
jgi:membrane fusion protein (multidrug efflux system)